MPSVCVVHPLARAALQLTVLLASFVVAGSARAPLLSFLFLKFEIRYGICHDPFSFIFHELLLLLFSRGYDERGRTMYPGHTYMRAVSVYSHNAPTARISFPAGDDCKPM